MQTPLHTDLWSDSTTTAEAVGNSTERPMESFPFYIAETYLGTICPPFMLLFGIFGNVMTIVIMRRATSGDSTIHIYFMFTAVFDTIFLSTSTLSQWVQFTFGFGIRASHSVVCKLYTWLYAGGRVVSAWCLVSMTVHRAMSVVWPHRVNVLCTRRTVLLVLTGITVFIALLYSHSLVGFGRVYSPSKGRYRCSVRFDDKNYVYFFQNIVVFKDLLFYSILPFIFLALSNSVLIWKLSASLKATSRKLTQGDSEQACSRERAANSVTLTVIVVSLAFIVLTLPVCIVFILNYLTLYQEGASGYEVAKQSFIYAVFAMLGDANSSVNFYLYCLTGRRFREEFLKVLYCGRNRERRGFSQ